jgi:hypothetical protein
MVWGMCLFFARLLPSSPVLSFSNIRGRATWNTELLHTGKYRAMEILKFYPELRPTILLAPEERYARRCLLWESCP